MTVNIPKSATRTIDEFDQFKIALQKHAAIEQQWLRQQAAADLAVVALADRAEMLELQQKIASDVVAKKTDEVLYLTQLAESQREKLVELLDNVKVIQSDLHHARDLLHTRDQQIHAIRTELTDNRTQLADVISSTSWRITAPFRKIRSAISYFRHRLNGSKEKFTRYSL